MVDLLCFCVGNIYKHFDAKPYFHPLRKCKNVVLHCSILCKLGINANGEISLYVFESSRRKSCFLPDINGFLEDS